MQTLKKQEIAKILENIYHSNSASDAARAEQIRQDIKNKLGIDVDSSVIEKSSEQDLYIKIFGILYGLRRINTVGAVIVNSMIAKSNIHSK